MAQPPLLRILDDPVAFVLMAHLTAGVLLTIIWVATQWAEYWAEMTPSSILEGLSHWHYDNWPISALVFVSLSIACVASVLLNFYPVLFGLLIACWGIYLMMAPGKRGNWNFRRIEINTAVNHIALGILDIAVVLALLFAARSLLLGMLFIPKMSNEYMWQTIWLCGFGCLLALAAHGFAWLMRNERKPKS